MVTGIFKAIATGETEIERYRQELAQTRDFDAKILFDKINTNGDDHISAEELLKFMTDNNIKDATVENCQAIIAEYDGSGDKSMQYDEFLNMVMPAANESLREYAMYGRRGYVDPRAPLSGLVSNLASKLLGAEVTMQNDREAGKKDLAGNPDYNKYQAFNQISRGRQEISMYDLTQYLEIYGFYSRSSDIEAIRRRCDHDADGFIGIGEFDEICDTPTPPAEDQTSENIRAERQKIKDEMTAAAENYEKEREAIAQAERDEREKQMREWKEKREAEEKARIENAETARKEYEEKREKDRFEAEMRAKEDREKRDKEYAEW